MMQLAQQSLVSNIYGSTLGQSNMLQAENTVSVHMHASWSRVDRNLLPPTSAHMLLVNGDCIEREDRTGSCLTRRKDAS